MLYYNNTLGLNSRVVVEHILYLHLWVGLPQVFKILALWSVGLPKLCPCRIWFHVGVGVVMRREDEVSSDNFLCVVMVVPYRATIYPL